MGVTQSIILALLASTTIIVASSIGSNGLSLSEQARRLLNHNNSSAAYLSYEAIFARYGSAIDMIEAFSTGRVFFLEIMDSEARAHYGAGRNTTQAIFNDICRLLERAWVHPSECEPPQLLSLAESLQRVKHNDPVGMSCASICALLRITATLKHALPKENMVEMRKLRSTLKDFELALIRPALGMVSILSVKRLAYACGCSWKCSRLKTRDHLKSAFPEAEIAHYVWRENLAFVAFLISCAAIGWIVVWAYLFLTHNSQTEKFAFVCAMIVYLWLRAAQFMSYCTLI